MNDDDVIRKKDVLNMAYLTVFVDDEGRENDEPRYVIDASDVERLPPVPQGLSAREYGRMREQICAQYEDECSGCPLYYNKRCHFDDLDERAFSQIEHWMKEHPKEV